MNIRKTLSKSVLACLALALFVIPFNTRVFAGEGAVDTTFNVVANNPVYCAQVQPNGRILIGGAFTTINNVQRYGFARLFPDGTLDASISNVVSSGATIYAMLVQPDGKFVLAGSFSFFAGESTHQNIVRLNVDGSVDGTFTNSAPNSSIYAVAQQTDGKILIGGQFYALGNSNHYYIARLNIDGTVDNSFNAGTISGNMVNAIAVQNDGNILIGGSFSQFSTYGVSRNNIARLTTNGTPDLSYSGSATSIVQAVYLEPSGKSVWGGFFTGLDNFSRSHVGRLNTDGSVDATFNGVQSQGPSGNVYDVAEDTNDDVYVGGQFSSYNGLQRGGVARLFSDGTMDTNFNIPATNFFSPIVRCAALQGDGKVIVGGQFTAWNSFGRTNLVRLYGNSYPAEIITQPHSTNVTVGTNVTFSVDVSNPTAVDYQWFYNGSAILDATDNEYSIFNAQVYDSGTYSVFVNTSLGGTASSNAVLQVGIAPMITQSPTNITVTQGQTATFSASATGTPLNYYWFSNGTIQNITSKTPVGTNATLTLPNVIPSEAGYYSFVVSNFLGSVTNPAVTLTVLYPVSINFPPQSQSVGVGGTASFNVSATGDPINYQWLKNGTPIPGATAAGYQITNVMFSDAAGYSVVVSNQFNSQTSSIATLTVGYPPTVTQQPTNVTANLGDTVSFSGAVSGTGPSSYQWLFNSNTISGQTGTNIILTNVQIANIGYYALSVTSPFGSATSSNAFLNLNGYPSNLYFGLIAYYPFSGNANDATGNGNNGVVSNATLTQDRFGNPAMAYQFDGATSYISCNIPNIPVGSAPRTLSLWAQASVTNSPGANAAWWGAPVFLQGFGILSTGTPDTWFGQLYGGSDDINSGVDVDTNWHQIVLTYNGSILAIAVDGVEQNSLGVITSTALSPFLIGEGAGSTNFFPGSIDEVRIYDRALSVNDVAALYQYETGVPVIQQQPQSLSLVAGQTANFNVQAASLGNLSYQWYYSNAPVANATNSMLTIPSVQPANAGPYYVVVSDSVGSATSSTAMLSVGTPPQNLRLQFNHSGYPMISLQGTTGVNYVLQTTTSLQPPVVWQNIATNSPDTNGNWTFTDTNPASSGARFYRIAAP